MSQNTRKEMIQKAVNELHKTLGAAFYVRPLFMESCDVEVLGFGFRGAHASIDLSSLCHNCENMADCKAQIIEEAIQELELIHTDVEDAIYHLKHTR